MTAALYDTFREAGVAVAGALGDLTGRAHVYHHLYLDSGGRNVFPLIAAHGAMWGIGYFRQGEWGARLLSLRYLFQPSLRQQRLQGAARFADQFRDINRRVCAESYAIYYYTKHCGADDFIRSVIGDEFASMLEQCHASNRAGTLFPQAQRERLFLAFMQWEQEHVVAARVRAAFAGLEWPVLARLARRPTVSMNYLGRKWALRFRDFADMDDRIRGGLQAYRRAEELGLANVEQALSGYAPVAGEGAPCFAFQSA